MAEIELLLTHLESRWVVETLGDVAEFFGVELVTVREWRTGPVPMPGDQGAWDLKAITRWRCERLKANVNAKPKEIQELEIREKQIDVAKKELILRQKQGDLVSRTAAKAKLFEIMNDARVQLEALPGAMGSRVDPKYRDDLTQSLEKQVRLILKAMQNKAENEAAAVIDHG
jgi:hypothetical protein